MIMEGVRRRKPAAGGDDRTEEKSGGGEGGRSAKIDDGCTYLILLLAITISSCCLLVWLVPDHPLATLIMTGLDSVPGTIAGGFTPACAPQEMSNLRFIIIQRLFHPEAIYNVVRGCVRL